MSHPDPARDNEDDWPVCGFCEEFYKPGTDKDREGFCSAGCLQGFSLIR